MKEDFVRDDMPSEKISTNQITPGPDKLQNDLELAFGLNDVPPWYLSAILGFQHYLTMFGSTIAIPFILSDSLCIGQDLVSLSEIVGTIFFVSGLVTLIQTTFGIRLPIVQGGTFSFLAPSFAILGLEKWQCPAVEDLTVNSTMSTILDQQEIWQSRMRELQGAIMVASCFQVIIGFSGIMGLLLRFIGPLTIAPTITLVGLSLFPAAADFAGKHWGISFLTMVLIILFSQFLKNINVPICGYAKEKGCHCSLRYAIFKLFPILFGIFLSWFICFILTVTDAIPDNPDIYGYAARTDTRLNVLSESKWFRFPYPGQWGTPTVSVAGVFGMLAGVLASMMESIGDYYACARLSGAPPPPLHAINRGIGVEGIGCILAGAWGSGSGTTSYSENIGAIGITKVGSRFVIQCGALFMIVLGMFGKFGAFFVAIPEPIIGGIFCIMFAMVTAVGISNLQFVDLNSTRNLFIMGFSVFIGIVIPTWFSNPNNPKIQTGSPEFDQIVTVLLKTSMFVGGLIGFVLDNTIPGTKKERGLDQWEHLDNPNNTQVLKDYGLPLMKFVYKYEKVTKYFPFCPTYKMGSVKSTSENRASEIKISEGALSDHSLITSV